MIALLVQAALFIALIEAALCCLPREVRRASQANCLRPNGSRSTGRTRAERQAYHRLRLELAAALLLIFLLGNAVYQTIDQAITPVPRLISGLTQSLGWMVATETPAESITIGAWTRVAMLGLSWFLVSLLIAGWRPYFVSRNFAEGVRSRRRGYPSRTSHAQPRPPRRAAPQQIFRPQTFQSDPSEGVSTAMHY